MRAAAARYDDVSVAKDSPQKALVHDDGFDLIKHKLDGARAQHTDFHHDTPIGDSKIGALPFDECNQQQHEANDQGYPREPAPTAICQQPRDRQ